MGILGKYKKVIKPFLDQLECDISNEDEFSHIQDTFRQNQSLYSIYQRYSGNVFDAIEALKQDSIITSNISSRRYFQKEYTKIVEYFELENCPIISSDPFLTNRNRLLDYVVRMKVKMNNNYYLSKRKMPKQEI